MAPHQQRVIDEQKELETKIEALSAFIATRGSVFDAMEKQDQYYLQQQLTIMVEYNRILNVRIQRF